MKFLPRSRQARRWIAIGAVGATVAGAASVAWASSRDSGDTSDVPSTRTATASLQTFEKTIVTTGTFQPAVTAELTFPVEGDIESVNVAEGDTVVEGDVLATVGTESLEAELAAAESNLDAALEQLESDQDNDASDAQLAASEAAVTAAESQLTVAEEALHGAQLRATVDGTVAAVNIAAGDHVSGSGTSGGVGGAGGTNTTTTTSADVVIISTDRFVVETSVSTADVGRLATGLQAEMTPSDTNDTVFGTVGSVGLVAESTDGGVATFPVEIEVTGEVEGIYVGGSATVTIIVSQRSDVLAVPAAGLTTTDGQTTATVVQDGQQIDIPVEVGESFGGQTEIVSGISEGDEVVINLAVPGGDQDDDGENGQDGSPGFPGGGRGFPGGDGFQGGGGGGFPGGGFPGGQG